MCIGESPASLRKFDENLKSDESDMTAFRKGWQDAILNSPSRSSVSSYTPSPKRQKQTVYATILGTNGQTVGMKIDGGYHIRTFCRGGEVCPVLKMSHRLSSFFSTSTSITNTVSKHMAAGTIIPLQLFSSNGTWFLFGKLLGSDAEMVFSMKELANVEHILNTAKDLKVSVDPKREVELEIKVQHKVTPISNLSLNLD